jgi:hypothetical protein
MGQCYGKAGGASSRRADHDAHAHAHAVAPPSPLPANGAPPQPATPGRRKSGSATPVHHQAATTAWPSPYPAGGASPLPAGVSPSPARSTPRRFFKRPFPPPSPAKHIKATLAKRLGGGKPKEGTIPEEGGAGVAADSAEAERPLDKTFGFANNFGAKYDLGKEVGRGHFGHTCSALVKKGEYKGHAVAVKIISKAKVLKALLVGGGGGGVHSSCQIPPFWNILKFQIVPLSVEVTGMCSRRTETLVVKGLWFTNFYSILFHLSLN